MRTLRKSLYIRWPLTLARVGLFMGMFFFGALLLSFSSAKAEEVVVGSPLSADSYSVTPTYEPQLIYTYETFASEPDEDATTEYEATNLYDLSDTSTPTPTVTHLEMDDPTYAEAVPLETSIEYPTATPVEEHMPSPLPTATETDSPSPSPTPEVEDDAPFELLALPVHTFSGAELAMEGLLSEEQAVSESLLVFPDEYDPIESLLAHMDNLYGDSSNVYVLQERGPGRVAVELPNGGRIDPPPVDRTWYGAETLTAANFAAIRTRYDGYRTTTPRKIAIVLCAIGQENVRMTNLFCGYRALTRLVSDVIVVPLRSDSYFIDPASHGNVAAFGRDVRDRLNALAQGLNQHATDPGNARQTFIIYSGHGFTLPDAETTSLLAWGHENPENLNQVPALNGVAAIGEVISKYTTAFPFQPTLIVTDVCSGGSLTDAIALSGGAARGLLSTSLWGPASAQGFMSRMIRISFTANRNDNDFQNGAIDLREIHAYAMNELASYTNRFGFPIDPNRMGYYRIAENTSEGEVVRYEGSLAPYQTAP